jgi:hypothetical protein
MRGAPCTVLLALLLACGTAQAAEWVLVGKSENSGDETFVDTASIRAKGSIRQAWFKMVPEHHKMQGWGPNAQRWVDHFLGKLAFNCSEETQRSEATTYYYEGGEIYVVDAINFPSAWQPVQPESIAAKMMKYACSWKPK